MTISRLKLYRRKTILPGIVLLADLGASVMDDAFVESAAYILSKRPDKKILAIDLRGLVEPRNKLAEKIALIKSNNWNIKDRQLITDLPDSKLLYSLPIRVHELLDNAKVLEPEVATVRQGMGTFSDFRFLRLRQELPVLCIHRNGWEPLAKGGAFSFYYSDIHLFLNWNKDGAELSAVNIAQNGQDAQIRQASEYWRRSGLTYSKRSQKGFSVRALPADCIIAGKGPAILSQSDVSALYLLGWVNSRFIRWIIEIQANDHEYNTGILKKLPWIQTYSSDHELIVRTLEAVKRLQYAHAINETNSCYFPIFNAHTIKQLLKKYNAINSDAQVTLSSVMAEWDRFVDNTYGVDSKCLQCDDLDQDTLANDDEDEQEQVQETLINGTYFVSDVLGMIIGFIIGRWDIRFSTGKRQQPDLCDPFAALPVCPPGMLQNSEGLPAYPKDVPADYPLRITWPGILVDDENHPEDIVTRLREVLEVIWRDRADAIEQEACELLGMKTLRDYFRRPSGFFADHLKRYSKSRRQAPIYWPLSTVSGSYTLWIYYHRLTDQTLHTALADFVDPKIKSVRTEINALRESGKNNKRLEELRDLETELTDFRNEIERVIKLPWRPNLNDGVIITASPLWKLFRLPKWQKDLKACWEKLEKGEYDWAHLAYSIWPKRVEEACKKDRSIAIAHNLEHLCEVEPNVIDLRM